MILAYIGTAAFLIALLFALSLAVIAGRDDERWGRK